SLVSISTSREPSPMMMLFSKPCATRHSTSGFCTRTGRTPGTSCILPSTATVTIKSVIGLWLPCTPENDLEHQAELAHRHRSREREPVGTIAVAGILIWITYVTGIRSDGQVVPITIANRARPPAQI